MVDALRRACRFVTPCGLIVDIHPTAKSARLEVGLIVAGDLDAGDARIRHQAASAAVTAAVREGILTVEHSTQFDFYTYGDSPEELAEYVEENWRDARIPKDTLVRAREALDVLTDLRPRVLERVGITVLRPAKS